MEREYGKSGIMPIPGERFKNIALALIVVLSVGGSFFYAFNSGNIAEKFLASLPGFSEEAPEPAENIISDVPEERVYVEKAGPGEGITHIARRVTSEYIRANEGYEDITPEHRIYIEDYIQKKLGGDPILEGEKVSISRELVSQAIEHSRELSSEDLNNLKQYSSLVLSFN